MNLIYMKQKKLEMVTYSTLLKDTKVSLVSLILSLVREKSPFET